MVDKLDDIIEAHCHSPQKATVRGKCPRCKERTILVLTPSMTMYDWDGKGEDPNRPRYWCEGCSEEYTEMMRDQWADYYGGLL